VSWRHSSHITVILSKAAHSGLSVCLRVRAPCPLRVSRPGADRAGRAVKVVGSYASKLLRSRQVCDKVVIPTFSSRTEPDEQLRFLTPFHAQCTLLCGPYRHICVCARSTAVFHGTSQLK
jgi:hypothetical protein